jgi:type IV pilus assembly protein PilV
VSAATPGARRGGGGDDGARSRGARGFSLVEVLVSIAIVAMGVLAVAGLLGSATRSGKRGEQVATATLLAEDIADRIRANRAGAADYALAAGAWPPATAPAGAPCDRAAPCGPPALAQADLARWTRRLRALLPLGSGALAYRPASTAAGPAVDVWIGWRDPDTLPAAADERAGTRCPPAWSAAAAPVRCLFLQVGL